jgi:iron complex transport system ATP-binding protein
MKTQQHAITLSDVTINYANKSIIEALNLTIRKGEITALIGPNGCGKSTLLKSINRLLTPKRGSVFLHCGSQNSDFNVHEQKSNAVARLLAMLPQITQSPEGITVKTLVAFGRAPYLNQFGVLRQHDHQKIELAMQQAKVIDLADQYIDQLSGGQLQRVWIALVLAQDTDIILLDEPTTYLDICHQFELLNLMVELNRQGKTIVVVMHDLNQACRYADNLVIMKEGKVVTKGFPEDVFTSKMLKDVFNFDAVVINDPESQTPMSIARQANRPHRAKVA